MVDFCAGTFSCPSVLSQPANVTPECAPALFSGASLALTQGLTAACDCAWGSNPLQPNRWAPLNDRAYRDIPKQQASQDPPDQLSPEEVRFLIDLIDKFQARQEARAVREAVAKKDPRRDPQHVTAHVDVLGEPWSSQFRWLRHFSGLIRRKCRVTTRRLGRIHVVELNRFAVDAERRR